MSAPRAQTFSGLRLLGCAALLAASLVTNSFAATKTLYIAQQSIGGEALDPARVNSVLVANILENIFEPMLQYDYLARPLKLIPNTLASMPEISEGGRVYTCHLKHGVMFAPDPAFKGKPRELTAADYAYSIRRLFNPKYVSSQFFLVDGKIPGANALRDAALKGAHFDDDKPIAGLQVLDRYTLRITLNEPDLNFQHVLAQQNLGAMAREVVEFYGDDVGTHPVGTGPFHVVNTREGSKLILVANPNFRHEIFAIDPSVTTSTDEVTKSIAATMKGRRLPMVDRVELTYTSEDQPMWLAFLGRDLDYMNNVPVAFLGSAVPNGQLAPNLKKQDIALQRYVYPAIWFAAFNMMDPVVGGYTPERTALRRAIAMSFDRDKAINVIFNGGALPPYGVTPPGISGFDAKFRTDAFDYDVPRAKALLDTYGFIDRDGDGWRDMPDGSPLVITFSSPAQPRFRPWDELWSRSLQQLGIRMKLQKMHQSELTRMMMSGKHQLGFNAWNMDYPDGEDFQVLLYGPAAGTVNQTQFSLPAFDKLFLQAQKLPDSPERNVLYREMDRIALVYMPMVMHLYPVRAALAHPWIKGYKPHPVHLEPWKYIDIDTAMRQQVTGRNE
ncbi:MAG: ABC transporter substrate-binding protein [Betaproteobacteria bacterium]